MPMNKFKNLLLRFNSLNFYWFVQASFVQPLSQICHCAENDQRLRLWVKYPVELFSLIHNPEREPFRIC